MHMGIAKAKPFGETTSVKQNNGRNLVQPIIIFEKDGKLITRSVHAELREIKAMTEQLAEICAEIHHIKKRAVERLKTPKV